MLKRILFICAISTIILTIITTLKLSPRKEMISYRHPINIVKKEKNKEQQIGNLIIKKIDLNEPLFKITSKENTIEKHVTILKESIFPSSKDSIIFIAAHSGTGKIAYFEKLDELKKDDRIILKLNNENYTYFVKDIWEEKKNGYINVNKEAVNQLILTTCSPKRKNYQLIINCISKS